MQTRRSNLTNLPTLILVAGSHDRKPRSLEREVTTVGRARGCDLCLEANEISTLHCVIYRTAEGYRIRDCNSRCGTRINGAAVKNGVLHDADIVNLGPFSFEFHLPAALFPGADQKLDPLQIEQWKTSRRRLAQLALKFRKRLQSSTGSPREHEYSQKTHLLREKIRSYDQRLKELEGAEEELTQERQQLADEVEQHRERVQKIEEDLAARLAQTDKDVHERWQEFQRRCQAEEFRPRALETMHSDLHPDKEPAADKERVVQLEKQFERRHAQWLHEQQEFTTMKEQWAREQATASATIEDQMAGLARQKADLTRMMGDLKKLQEDLRKQAKPDVRALHDQVERLERENAELREACANRAAPDLDDLQAEVALLHEELQTKELTLAELQNGGGRPDTELQAENELLKKLLEEKEQALAELSQKPSAAPKSENDLEHYETELNEFRRQLENDRGKLNKEVETLRDRNKELDEAIREMEMEMSKERAELARERMRLERVREEVKSDAERLQREQSVRDTMAPVQKLRDELNGKQPPAKSDKAINDRLRSMRSQLSEPPSAAS